MMNTKQGSAFTKNEATYQLSSPQGFPEIVIKKMDRLAKIVNVESDELWFWLNGYPLLDTSTALRLLHLAINHKLDPLMGEVALWFDSNQRPHPSITIDGWMKIINNHAAFTGIEFEEGTLSESVTPLNAPPSMQCTIYRSDRQSPIRVREYLTEVKNDHPLWVTMPRRMLRHRALQQCARLAFGISTPEFASQELSTPAQSHDPSKQIAVLDKELSAKNEMVALGDLKNNSAKHRLSRTEQLKERLNRGTREIANR